jgi:hypothetical protein
MKNISVLVFSTLLVGAIGAVAFFSSASVSPKAKATVEVCFCHNVNNNPITVCTDNQGLINGHQNHVDSGMDTLGRCVVTPTTTPTPIPTVTVTPTPEECHGNGEKACPTPTPTTEPTVTPEPTQAPGNPGNPGGGGGPGDGLSDGRSDGLSSCPDCTKAPSGGQVLGASTDFAGTGVASDMIANAVGVLGGISTAAGLALSAKKKLIT